MLMYNSLCVTHFSRHPKLKRLFSLGNDGEIEVRKHVCQALVLLLELSLDRLMPYMTDIIKVE